MYLCVLVQVRVSVSARLLRACRIVRARAYVPALAPARCASACMPAHVCVCVCTCAKSRRPMRRRLGTELRVPQRDSGAFFELAPWHACASRVSSRPAPAPATSAPILGCVCAGQHDVLVRGRACLWHRAVLVARHSGRNRKCRCARPCDIFLPARTNASALARSRVRILTDARQCLPLQTHFRPHSHSATLTVSHARNAHTLHTPLVALTALLQILATAPIVGAVFDATDFRKPLWAVGMAFLTLYTYAPHAPVPLLSAAGPSVHCRSRARCRRPLPG